MAIKLPDGRIMRTLPEQVDKNMQDIASINNEVNVIKESITTAYKIQGSATVADLNANTPDAAMNGYVYNMTDAGSLINSDESTTSVLIGDNVVLVWNEGNYFWDCLSGVVDTSNLVTLDTDQTITGTKTINDTLIISNGTAKLTIKNNGWTSTIAQEGGIGLNLTGAALLPTNNAIRDLGSSSYQWKDLYLNNALYVSEIDPKVGSTDFTMGNTSGVINSRSTFRPATDNGRNLGTQNLRWKDLYLSGNITDGMNSVTVAQISKTKLYKHKMTVSNVTGPVNVILTHNTPITGSFGANMSSQIVIAAYLTAQSNASQMKTPNGGLAQINSDGTISITVSAGGTITDDTVTEL